MSTGPAPVPAQSSSEQADKAPREGTELLVAAARASEPGKKDTLTDQERQDALDWFLSDTQDDIEHTFQINVGSKDRPRWVDWTIRPVDMEKLRRIRRAAAGNRRQRRAGGVEEFDENNANVQIVLEGTVYPDLRRAAQQIGTADPADAVKTRFARKPGLIAQISGEIMNLSGYDDEDVREVDAASG